MAETVELEEIERLIEQLPPVQRLKLIARICEQLSTVTAIDQMESEAEKTRNERVRLAKQLLSEVKDVEDDSQGEFDVVEDIKRLRQERIKRICQSDV